MELKRPLLVVFCVSLLARLPARGDDVRPDPSRAMTTAIRFYEKGDDMRAMDLFMDILTKGAPSERSTANEYINLITHRMNSDARVDDKSAPSSKEAATEPENGASPESSPRRPATIDAVEEPAAPAPARKPAAAPALAQGVELTASNRVLMGKEIKARLRSAQERSLAELKSVPGVRVVSRANGDPLALGIPSALLFQSGIAFQRDARRLLDPLTRLVFALGGAQVLILPEGAAIGDAKVLDMRRTMGISAALYQAGVAPPRVRVNLLNSQVDIPKPLLDFTGVVIAFQYDQPLNLSVDSAVGDELGPPISLGVFPQQIRPSRNQGAIIEFSVSDPASGLVSWKFQLLKPSSSGADSEPLQEVVGGGAVFHQIFWNGRKNYFGAALPHGRYECVLTALDAKNRRRTLHKWIVVLPPAGDEEKLLSTGGAPERGPGAPATPAKKGRSTPPSTAAPSADFPDSDGEPLIKGVKAAAKESSKARKDSKPKREKKIARRGDRAKKAVNADAAARTGPYKLDFAANTHQMTAASETLLASAAAAASVDPSRTLKVIGHAAAEETDGAALADRRAKLVAGLLINRYQMDPKRIAVSSASGERATVEVLFVRAEQ